MFVKFTPEWGSEVKRIAMKDLNLLFIMERMSWAARGKFHQLIK